jgi:myo-inositol-1(or 4)-monophosphatase
MQPLLNIAIAAARQAGEIILRYVDQLEHIKITSKGPHDFCTEIDIKAEQSIIQSVLKAHPDHGIVAEEHGIINPNASCTWIIDPLDGTNNYLHGFPFYAVSIGIQIKNRLEHAVVYDPLRHECFVASRGRGARLNDHRLRVSKKTQLNHAMLGANIQHRDKTSQPISAFVDTIVPQCQSVRYTGSAALELAYVASGRLDAFIGFGLKPWDIAAGYLLIQEAGGIISDFDGGETCLTKGHVIAGTPKLFKALLQVAHEANSPGDFT